MRITFTLNGTKQTAQVLAQSGTWYLVKIGYLFWVQNKNADLS